MWKLKPSSSELVAFGIDLGTTNSTLCRTELTAGSTTPSEPEVIELHQPTFAGGHVGTLFPSVVALHQGTEYVGQGAKDLRARMADHKSKITRNVNLFFDCKNEIGTSRSYPNAPEGYRSPTEIAAKILAYIRREGTNETTLDNSVVTVPASFQAAQRNETAKACAFAGIDVSRGRLLDEPVAAFIDYAFRYDPKLGAQLEGSKRLLVFDFGGGTCDIAAFELEAGNENAPMGIGTMAVSRYHRLGGSDIDLAILHEILVPQLCAENGLGEFDLSYRDKAQIIFPAFIAVAEALKIQICNEVWRLEQFGQYADRDPATVVAQYPAQTSVTLSDGQTVKLSSARITAEEFERVLEPFLDTDRLYVTTTEYRLECSIFAPLDDALERGELDPYEVDYVLAMGGSSLIPQVIWALEREFPKATVLQYEDRKDAQLAVARGASLQALSLAVSGQGIVAPVAQDDIYLSTQEGGFLLVAKGMPLPYPPEGMKDDEGLVVPTDALQKEITLSVELTAGDERRQLFRDTWQLVAVCKGEPLRLNYAYDANQVLSLSLTLARFSESVPFKATIDNPLSHVVNPNETQEEIDRLEEEYRQDPSQANELIPRIAELCAKLGQYEKAINLVRALLNLNKRPIGWLLNRRAIYEEARGNTQVAIKTYEEAAKASPGWGGPLFNLALLYDKRGKPDLVLGSVDRALDREDTPAYKTLRLRTRRKLQQSVNAEVEAREILESSDALDELDDWELGWYRSAAEMAKDDDALNRVREEQRRRGHPEEKTSSGILPAMMDKE